MEFSDFIYIPLFIFLALQFPRLLLKGREYKFYPTLKYLVYFHFLIGVGYYFVTRNGGGDAWGYWRMPRYMNYDRFMDFLTDGEGTLFMYALNYLPVTLLDLSYLANTMFFSMLGSFGITYFFVTALRVIPHTRKVHGIPIFPWIFFLPNLHFWCSGVGKDTLSFMCMGMIVYGLLKPMKSIPLFVIAGLIMVPLRPHMILFIVAGLGAGYILGGQISWFKRILYSGLLIGATVIILPQALSFAKVEDASVESFDKFADHKSSLLSRKSSGSRIDIASYPLPLKIATFWFRPLFFDARNVNSLMASAENLILIYLFIMAMRASPVRAWRKAPFLVKGLFFYLALGSFAFSQSLGNLGIMIRMRNMFLPAMIIFLLWVFSYEREGQLARVRRIKAIRKRRELQQLNESGEAV